ncbi:hypothetical protein BJX99DRAFT_264239 [Aspergillus californicus]
MDPGLRSAEDARYHPTESVSNAGKFMWVDRDKKSQDRDAFNAKQSFIRARYHRRKRETQLQNLKSSMRPFPTLSRLALPQEKAPLAPPLVVGQSPQLGVVDSVLSVSLHTDQNVNLYFYHFQAHCSKSYLPLFSDKTTWLLRTALSQPALLQIILSMSAFHRANGLLLRDANPRIVQRSANDALEQRGKGIRSLQQALAEQGELCSEGILMAVAHIIYIEGAEGNVGAVDAHMSGLKKIIDLLGGFDNLDYQMMTMVYCCDLVKGLIESPLEFYISPKWECKVRQESVFLKDSDDCTTSLLGSRFFNSAWSRNLHPGLKPVIQSFQKAIPVYESQRDGLSAGSIPSEHDYLVLFGHQLCSLGRDSPLDPFQETLRLAIQVYTVIRMWNFKGMPCAEHTVSMLRRSLEKSFPAIQHMAPDLLFWILFMGGLGTNKRDCYAWFLDHLSETARLLHIDDWDDNCRNSLTVCEKSGAIQAGSYCKIHRISAFTLWASSSSRSGPARSNDSSMEVCSSISGSSQYQQGDILDPYPGPSKPDPNIERQHPTPLNDHTEKDHVKTKSPSHRPWEYRSPESRALGSPIKIETMDKLILGFIRDILTENIPNQTRSLSRFRVTD